MLTKKSNKDLDQIPYVLYFHRKYYLMEMLISVSMLVLISYNKTRLIIWIVGMKIKAKTFLGPYNGL